MGNSLWRKTSNGIELVRNINSNLTTMIPSNPTYGDGSRNEINNTYNNKIYVGNDLNPWNWYYTYYNNRNCYNSIKDRLETLTGVTSPISSHFFDLYVSGWNAATKSATFTEDLDRQTNINRTIAITFSNDAFAYANKMSTFKIKISNNWYTLNQAIAAGFIEPLILMGAYKFGYIGFINGAVLGPVDQGFDFWVIFRLKNHPITAITVWLETFTRGSSATYVNIYEYNSTISLTRVGNPVPAPSGINAIHRQNGGLVNL